MVGKLIRVGYSEEALEAMDRDAMLAAWAVCVADGKDKPEQGTQAPVIGYDVELERKRLEFEKRKFEEEQKFKWTELESQEKLKQAELGAQKN